jgi:hypothetical protein
MGKKVISFSLWGDNPKYTMGAIRNAELAKDIYPGWECWFYINVDHFSEGPPWIDELIMVGEHVKIMLVESPQDWRMMFDRFQAILCPIVDVMIVRDCDSRLTLREKAAVDEWLASETGFHIMRDHPWHGSPILGGMWGTKNNALPEFLELLRGWKQEDRWQTDQDFLASEIYPRVVSNAMIHASFLRMEPHAKDFPVPRSGTEFVGQVFDENEVTVREHAEVLAQAL